jgi:hypothetical protein
MVMRAWTLSTINVGECKSQHAWGKREFVWERRGVFLHGFFGATRKGIVLELEDNHSGNVCQLVGAVNS